MGATTTRIDLKKVGRVVLVKVDRKWEPYQITEHDVYNNGVNGIWLLTGEEKFLKGDTPTLNFNKKWVGGYINSLTEKRDSMSDRIDTLKKLFELI